MTEAMEGLARWRGKVALITGASGGIGEGVATALAEAGMKVVLAARRREKLEHLRQRLEGAGAQVLVVEADVGKEADVLALFRTIADTWGGVDVLVNNAGVAAFGDLTGADSAQWRQMLDVNVMGLALCTSEALKQMEGKVEGQIINISSLAGHRVPPGKAVFYSATKHAVRALTDGWRTELVEKGSPVKIGSISPGVVRTHFFNVARGESAEGDPAEHSFTPLTPADIAQIVLNMLGTPRHVQIGDITVRSVEQPH